MRNIFVFCAGESNARSNFRKTILNPVSEGFVFSNTPPEKHAELRSWREQAGGFFAWGIRTNQRTLTMLKTIEPGDCVLGFFDFHYRVVSRLIGKLQNDQLAETLWGRPKGEWTWENIIFISKPREIAIPASSLQPYLCRSYRSAMRISSDRNNSIIRDFGSLDSFVTKSFGVV